MKKIKVLAAVAVAFTLMAGSSAMAGDAAKGKKLVKAKCKACHVWKKDSKKKTVGPNLFGVVGRPMGAATVKGKKFKYSKGYKAAMKNGGPAWTSEAIMEYLINPSKYLTKHAG